MSNAETIQAMLEMPMGTEKRIDQGIRVLRVPNGWIYTIVSKYTASMETSAFVPEPK